MGMFVHRHLTAQRGQTGTKPASTPDEKPRPVKRSTRKQGAK